MRNILIACISILVLSTSFFAQNETKPCPTIQIASPANLTMPGETMTFSVGIKDNSENLKLQYVWTVSLGTIIEGQNTSTIRVATTREMGDANVTAKVKIQGLPTDCAKELSETASIHSPPPDCGFDNYGEISWEEEVNGLDNLFSAVMNNPDTIAFIRLFTAENETIEQAKKRVEKIVQHANFREFSKRRLVFAIEKSNGKRTVISIFPENKELPECKNCEIIKGEDAK